MKDWHSFWLGYATGIGSIVITLLWVLLPMLKFLLSGSGRSGN